MEERALTQMKQPLAERFSVQPQRLRGWRPLFSKALALALVVSFIAGLMMSQAPAATFVCGFDAEIVCVEGSGDTPSDSGEDYRPVAHTVHCVGHSMPQSDAPFVEPVRTANAASFPVLSTRCSLSNLNPPKRPPRA